jgi:hypothetical protein
VHVAQRVQPAEIAECGDQVDARVGVGDGEGDGQGLVVVADVDHRGPGARHARAGHDVGRGEVAADELHVEPLGQRVLGDVVVPGAEHQRRPALRGQLGDDARRPPRRVAEQHDVVGQVQSDQPPQSLAPHRLQRGGQLREEQGERDDAADDDVGADDPARGRGRVDVAVADGGRGDDEVPPVGARRGDTGAGRLDHRHRRPAGEEDEDRDGQRQPPPGQPHAQQTRQARDQERHLRPPRRRPGAR